MIPFLLTLSLVLPLSAVSYASHGSTSYIRACRLGHITLPVGGKGLSANMTRQWILRAPRGHQIRIFLKKTELRLSEEGNCEDALSLKNGYPPFNEASQAVCGAWEGMEVLGGYRMTLKLRVGIGPIPSNLGLKLRYSCVKKNDKNATAPCQNMLPCAASMKDYMRWTQCQHMSSKCDGIAQCPGGEDERGCPGGPDWDPVTGTCRSDKLYMCAPKSCIPRKWLCDGSPDCDNGSDEKSENCPAKTTPAPKRKTKCSKRRFLCPAEDKCIRRKYVCDGDKDCSGGEDEKDCDSSRKKPQLVTTPAPQEPCTRKEFFCKAERLCIPKQYMCDGDEDCNDGSDEKACSKAKSLPKTTPAPKSCPNDGFMCTEDHTCIEKAFRCDGQRDCAAGEDEKGCRSEVACGDKEFPPRRSWPWSLVISKRGRDLCAGVLIGEKLALTAAHCARRCKSKNSRCIVSLADRKRKKRRKEVGIAAVALHPDFRWPAMMKDVALIKLEKSLGRRSHPICLKFSKKMSDGKCYIAGFGSAKKYHLEHAVVTKLPKAACSENMHGRKLSSTELCGNYSSELLDLCDSESGAPLSCYDQSKERWSLTGLVVLEAQCKRSQKMAVFQSLSGFQQWLEEAKRELQRD